MRWVKVRRGLIESVDGRFRILTHHGRYYLTDTLTSKRYAGTSTQLRAQKFAERLAA